jgi:xanthine dehydrogenase accessory factor
VTTPIGITGIRSKDPAAIAVSVAASVLQLIEAAAAPASGTA